jgi:hypothetical protein
MAKRPQDGVIDRAGLADGWDVALHPYFEGFGAQLDVFLLLLLHRLILSVSCRSRHMVDQCCKIGCFVSVDERGLNACRLSVDDAGDFAGLAVGNEDVPLVQIGMQQSRPCDALHLRLLNEIIENGLTVCHKLDMLLDRAPITQLIFWCRRWYTRASRCNQAFAVAEKIGPWN